MGKAEFPLVVKRGHTLVKIYLSPTRVCEACTVVHYLGDGRQRKTFADCVPWGGQALAISGFGAVL